MVASPDGKTIYYAAAGSIWSIPAADGTPQKLRKGDSVTLDPYRQELIVRLSEREGTRMVRQPLNGGAEQPISLEGDFRFAPILQYADAVSKDGRLLAQVTSPGVWFWRLGSIEPSTGRVEVIRVGYDADVGGGWTHDGAIVVNAIALHSSLWRFRPEVLSK
jgi:Tol biopolymer transport system component